MKLSSYVLSRLRCPTTHDRLALDNQHLVNEKNKDIKYPVVDGVPIILDDNKSLFSVNDFAKKKNTTFELDRSLLKRVAAKLRPEISVNVSAKKNCEALLNLLEKNSSVLVIGGSIVGQGMEKLYQREDLDIVGSDVSFGEYATLISDAHDIPFEDESFDAVIVQVVLEHVLDPVKCVEEIHRVLKKEGVVYSETPFIQQVHMQQYDFTRYTFLGHRRLFRHFSEIDSGICYGPGMAFAWSYVYFLRSFTDNKLLSGALKQFAYYTAFFWKYFDYFLVKKQGAYDGSSGFYFLGRKSEQMISDRELIAQFRGY